MRHREGQEVDPDKSLSRKYPDDAGDVLLDVHPNLPGFIVDGYQGSCDVAQGMKRWSDVA